MTSLDEGTSPSWRTRGALGIGTASFLSDAGHEVPTSLLPSFLTATLGAPAAALGVIEGIADGLAGVARLAGGAIADDPGRRRASAVGGYTATAVLSAGIGAATSVLHVGLLRVGAWTARGVRVASRNACVVAGLLWTAVSPVAAFGFAAVLTGAGALALARADRRA